MTQANVAANVLQFVVGTANLYGTSTGLNVEVTYRQPFGSFHPGDSGTLLNSPRLTVPGALPGKPGSAVPFDATSTIETGPSSNEADGHAMTSTSQQPGSTNRTTFGLSGGIFGLGIEPYNAYGSYDAPSSSQIGTPFQVPPYPVPLYDATAHDPNAFEPWGGPPAFDVAGNGQSIVGSPNYPTGSAGASMGIDVFASIAPAPGKYQLSVGVPANTGYVVKSASATLPAHPKILPPVVSAAVVGYGNGGATFKIAVPSGVTEAYIQITDYGPQMQGSIQPSACNTASTSAPIYYTIHVSSPGTHTLGRSAGPGGSASICTAADNTSANGGTATSGDQFAVQTIGFDYPAYEAAYPNSLGNPAPNIVGPIGEDDVTISPATCSVEPSPGGSLTSCAGSLPLGGLRR